MKANDILPVLYMLSLSLIGLGVPLLGHVLCFVCLVAFYLINRHDFVVALTILITVSGFYNPELDFPVKLYDLILFCGPFIAIYNCTKNSAILKLVIASFFFLLGIFILMSFSEEDFGIQFRTARQYICIFYFIVPVIVFKNIHFSFVYFLRRSLFFLLIICSMYIADGLILHENLFLPGVNGAVARWDDFNIIFGPSIKRIYPSGLYMLFLALFARRYITIPIGALIIIIIALFVTQTFTFILAILFTVFLYSSLRVKIRTALIGILLLSAAIIVEQKTNFNLRINEVGKQLFSLGREHGDIAEFGSQRGGQVIPNVIKLKNERRLLTGVGFLHNELSRSGKFMVDSYFNKEPDVMGIVEVTQIATLINIGLIGLLLLHFYFFGIYFLLPDVPERKLYLEAVVLFSIFGLGGFSGLNGYPTIIWLGLCIGVILLIQRQKVFEDDLLKSISKSDSNLNYPILSR